MIFFRGAKVRFIGPRANQRAEEFAERELGPGGGEVQGNIVVLKKDKDIGDKNLVRSHETLGQSLGPIEFGSTARQDAGGARL